MNDGPLCRCSTKTKSHGIRHNIYPGEQVFESFTFSRLDWFSENFLNAFSNNLLNFCSEHKKVWKPLLQQ